MGKVKYKDMFLCNVVWCPVHRTAKTAVDFTPRQICSFRYQLDFSRKQSAMLQLQCEEYSLSWLSHKHFKQLLSRANKDEVQHCCPYHLYTLMSGALVSE